MKIPRYYLQDAYEDDGAHLCEDADGNLMHVDEVLPKDVLANLEVCAEDLGITAPELIRCMLTAHLMGGTTKERSEEWKAAKDLKART